MCKGPGLEAFHFHQKLCKLIKPYLRAVSQKNDEKSKAIVPASAAPIRGQEALPKQLPKKKKPVKPPARLMVESAFLVLKLQQEQEDIGEVPPCGAEVASAGSGSLLPSWSLLAARRSVKRRCADECPQKLYFHVGIMNFTSYHFSGLELFESEARGDGSVALHVPNPIQVSRSHPFLAERIDFDVSWRMSFWILRSTKDEIPVCDMRPGTLIADKYLTIPEFIVWKGSRLESLDREVMAKQKRQTHNTTAKSKPKKSKFSSIPKAIADIYEDDDIVIPDQEEENQDEVAFAEMFGASESEDEAADSNELQDIAEELKDTPSLGKFAKHEQEKRLKANEPEQAGPQQPQPEPSSSSAAPPAPPIVRSVNTRVRTGTELKITVGDFGELVHYPQQNRMDAFCRNPAHSGGAACRRSRTLKENQAKPSQGRPIGLLIGWLRKSQTYDSQFLHTKGCHVSLAERQQARQWFSQQAGCERFTDAERPRRAGEPVEPEDIS